jgi:hypothetical protein
MVAITANLKTKDLALGTGHFLHCAAFMKFRGPQALKDRVENHCRCAASNLGQEDCHHRVDRVEERSVLRRPTSETTNSLRVSDRVHSISGDFSGGGRRVLETLGFESESQLIS